MSSGYIDDLTALLHQMAERNRTALPDAARMLASCIAGNGIVHAFGSGHSAMLAQEVFHRAGGLACINAMLDINLTIFGTSRPTWVERQEDYAASIFASYDVRQGEVMLIISTSGINAVPIEMAMEGRERGLSIIAIGSPRAYANVPRRHSSGKTLFDVADLVLDTCVPAGDAVHQLGQSGQRIGAVSTVLGGALLNDLVIRTAEELHQNGREVPVFASQNVPGGDEANAALIERFRPRIPLMKP